MTFWCAYVRVSTDCCNQRSMLSVWIGVSAKGSWQSSTMMRSALVDKMAEVAPLAWSEGSFSPEVFPMTVRASADHDEDSRYRFSGLNGPQSVMGSD